MSNFESRQNLDHRLIVSPSSSSRILASPKGSGIKLNPNKKVKSLTEILIKYLFSWHMWIEKLEDESSTIDQDPIFLINDSNTTHEEVFDPKLLEKDKLDPEDVLRYNNFFMANFNRNLKFKVINVRCVRIQLCTELRKAEDKHLEGKIESIFIWLNKNIFDGVLENVILEWSYRLKS